MTNVELTNTELDEKVKAVRNLINRKSNAEEKAERTARFNRVLAQAATIEDKIEVADDWLAGMAAL